MLCTRHSQPYTARPALQSPHSTPLHARYAGTVTLTKHLTETAATNHRMRKSLCRNKTRVFFAPACQWSVARCAALAAPSCLTSVHPLSTVDTLKLISCPSSSDLHEPATAPLLWSAGTQRPSAKTFGPLTGPVQAIGSQACTHPAGVHPPFPCPSTQAQRDCA